MQKALRKLPASGVTLFCLALVAVLGYLDYLTGDYSLLIFYALPVAVEAWLVGTLGVAVIAVAAGAARFISDSIVYSGTVVRYWNSLQDMVFLLVVGLLIATVRNQLAKDEEELER